MNDELQKKIYNHLIKYQTTPKCPLCKNDVWVINDLIFQLDASHREDQNNGFVYPVVPVTCEECGYTMFINAIKAGLIKGNDESDEPNN